MKKFKIKIDQLFENGSINRYMFDRFCAIDYRGINDNVFDAIIDDAIRATLFGVSNNKEYDIYFYTNRYCDDIQKDVGVVFEDCDKKRIYSHICECCGKELGFDSPVDYLTVIFRDFCKINKKAYPNVGGKNVWYKPFDVDKWIVSFKKIYNLMKSGLCNKKMAIDMETRDWDSEEKGNFLIWMKYYEEGNTEKYNLKIEKTASEYFIPESWVSKNNRDRENYGASNSVFNADDGKTKKERDVERAKAFKLKMKSRIQAIKKLMDKYNDIIPNQDIDYIYDELHKLDKSIGKLSVYATMVDCVYRTANRINKHGLSNISQKLIKIADDPVVSAVSEEKVDAIDSAKVNLPSVINRLEDVSKVLKTRDMIRELASIDILLNELGLASYFPELTDAQSKMIESFGYASNKIESIIAKLRGGEEEKGNMEKAKQKSDIGNVVIDVPGSNVEPVGQTSLPKPPQEKMKTEEIVDKPIGEVKKEIPVKK